MEKIRDTSGQDIVRGDPLRKRRLFWIAGIIGMLALLTAVAVPALMRWSSVEQSIAADRLRYTDVERGPFVRDVSVQGRIVAAVSPTLYSPAAGTVAFVVNGGDSVARGQVLAHIDSPELNSRLDQEQASLSGLQTGLKRSDIDARKQKLAQQKVVDNARVALTAAEREMRRAQSAYESKRTTATCRSAIVATAAYGCACSCPTDAPPETCRSV